jgi:uncharacterized transporter YbjL
MYNSLSFTNSWGGFRLFIDGIDVNTGREFSAFWRRKGLQVILLGVCFLLLGAGVIVVFLFAFYGDSVLEIIGYILALSGITYIVMGTIPLMKFRNPRAYQAARVEYAPNIV